MGNPIPGLPDHKWHPRSEWEPLTGGYPVDGPLTIWRNIDTHALHYTGADDLIDGDPGEDWGGMAQYLANIQRSYERNRGYSIGYWFGFDQRGHVWELRGYKYKSAANLGWNHRTAPYLLLVDGQDMASPMMVESVNLVMAETNRRAGRTCQTKPHRDIGSTQCPGTGVTVQHRAGVFHAATTPPPIPIPPPLATGDDMLHPINPFRNSDTRKYGSTLVPGQTYEFALNPIFPTATVAAAFNLAVEAQGRRGWLKMWPAGEAEPEETSVLNYEATGAHSNSTIMGIRNRRWNVKSQHPVELVVDVTAYWTP